jgi:hypothetical protein
MKRVLVVCALVVSSFGLTAGMSPAAEAAMASAQSPAQPPALWVVVESLPEAACDIPIRPPLSDMSGVRLVSSECWYKVWSLRGWTSPTATARSVMNYYSGDVRTRIYRLGDDVACRRQGEDQVCSRSIRIRSVCSYGEMTARLGPTVDGRRIGTLRIQVGLGC